MKESITTIIFDLDGTLADTSKDIYKCMNMALRHLGLPEVSMEHLRKGIGPGTDKLISLVLPPTEINRGDELLVTYRRFYGQYLLSETLLYPGVEEVLEKLQSCGFHLAVASNKSRYFGEKILQGLGVLDKFDVMVGPEDVEKPKPDPEMIFKTLEMIKASPAETLVVGDTTNDILVGKAAGTRTCVVTYGYAPLEVLLEAKPDFVIQKITQLMEVVDGVFSKRGG